jgi:hypothetical protein
LKTIQEINQYMQWLYALIQWPYHTMINKAMNDEQWVLYYVKTNEVK